MQEPEASIVGLLGFCQFDLGSLDMEALARVISDGGFLLR